MHSKPWELSARALEILWACHIPSQLSEKRSIWIPRVCTLEEEGGKKLKKKKRVGTEKENQKKMTVPTDNEAATHLRKCTSVDVVPAAFAKVAVWRLCQTERPAWGWNDSGCMPPRTILRHVWAIRVCLVRRKTLSAVRESGGLEGEEEGGEEVWGDDRVTGWLIIYVAHLSPNNTQTLDHRGGNSERWRDIKSKSETGEGGDR